MTDNPRVRDNITRFFDRSTQPMKENVEGKPISDSLNYHLTTILNANVNSVMDVGSGSGRLLIELLRAGVGHVIGVDLSAKANENALDRLTKENLQHRVILKTGSFLDMDSSDNPDVISLHSVLCCHPDREGMISKSVSYKPQIVTISIPKDWKILKFLFGLYGIIARLTNNFRPYIHSQKDIDKQLSISGYQIISRQNSGMIVCSTYELTES